VFSYGARAARAAAEDAFEENCRSGDYLLYPEPQGEAAFDAVYGSTDRFDSGPCRPCRQERDRRQHDDDDSAAGAPGAPEGP
jgi:hypothetical protein